MGGTKSNMCNEIAKDIWLWGVENNTWLSAAFIPGKENHEADKASRQFIDATEWMLNTNVFNESEGYTDNPKMANSTLVPSSTSCKESKLWAKERFVDTDTQVRRSASNSSEVNTDCNTPGHR